MIGLVKEVCATPWCERELSRDGDKGIMYKGEKYCLNCAFKKGWVKL